MIFLAVKVMLDARASISNVSFVCQQATVPTDFTTEKTKFKATKATNISPIGNKK